MNKISAIIPVVLAACLTAPTPAEASETGPSCVANVNYIHKSTSAGTAGNVKVYAETVCNTPMTSISVVVQLYRVVAGQRVLIGTSPDPVAYGVPSIGRSAVGGTCTPATYYAVSSHSATLGTFRFSDSRSEEQYVSCA